MRKEGKTDRIYVVHAIKAIEREKGCNHEVFKV